MTLSSEKDNLVDAMASIIGHGLATRFPKLRFMPVEYSSHWIRPFYEKLQRAYDDSPVLFDENPVEVFNRNVWVHAFHEPDPKGLIDLGIPVDHIMFGSDFPHPEGMDDPLAYSEVVKDLPLEQQALIMGGVAREGDEGRRVRLIGRGSARCELQVELLQTAEHVGGVVHVAPGVGRAVVRFGDPDLGRAVEEALDGDLGLRRASGAPAHEWMPWPNARCMRPFARSRRNSPGSSNWRGSRLAASGIRNTVVPAGKVDAADGGRDTCEAERALQRALDP